MLQQNMGQVLTLSFRKHRKLVQVSRCPIGDFRPKRRISHLKPENAYYFCPIHTEVIQTITNVW